MQARQTTLVLSILSVWSVVLGCGLSETLSPTEVPASATEIPATVTVPATGEVATGYNLLIVKRGEENMLVTNQSSKPCPITKLGLVNDRGSVEGSDWGIDTLDSGACIAIWKARVNKQAPREDVCELVADVPVSPPVL